MVLCRKPRSYWPLGSGPGVHLSLRGKVTSEGAELYQLLDAGLLASRTLSPVAGQFVSGAPP